MKMKRDRDEKEYVCWERGDLFPYGQRRLVEGSWV